MATTWLVRLYQFNPNDMALLYGSGAPEYGPSRALAGWAAVGVFSGAAGNFNETTVTFSDPDQNNRVSNSQAIDFRCGLPGEGDRDVVWVGLLAASNQGAQSGGLRAQAIPVSYVAVPGGRKRVAGAGGFTIASGALTFQL